MSTLYESYNDTFDKLPVKIYRHNLKGKYIWAPLHWHRSIEILVTFEGHNCVNIGSNDFVFSEDDWTVINSSELHSSRYLHVNDVLKGISVILSLSAIESWIGKDLFFHNPHITAVTNQVKELSLAIYNLDEGDSLYSLKLMNYTFQLMYLIADKCVKEHTIYTPPFHKAQAKAAAFLNYIEENYASELSLDAIASYFQYSPSYFSRFFKETVGVNYYAYLNYVRVNHATQMLIENNGTLTDCALSNGFPNVKSFISMFKRVHGCTPKSFLKR